MPPCFAGSKRSLEMVIYDPAAASKRARQAETTETSGTPSPTPSANVAAMALHAAPPPAPFGDFAPISAVPISAVPPSRLPPLAAGSGREEPPCLRRHFLVALGLRPDLPVHFVAEKVVTGTDLDAHQSRFRIPSDGVERRLRALLTPRELDDANLLHDPPPLPRKQPRHEQLEQPSSSEQQSVAAAEGTEQQPAPGEKTMKKPKRKGKVHGGLRVKLVDLAAGASRELLMSRWESSRGTVVKGEGYLDFVRRCSFRESDAVEIWAFVQRRVRLFGADVCGGSLLHLLVVKKHEKPQCRYCSGALCLVPPPTAAVESMGRKLLVE
ncbi:unnamed protein product [Urochloa decumbens]|uniref:Uncharacterized protein n=1 Tax=Urochloa decumbens TaxID=240449 RepID=A0ABC9AC12_9POAL